MLARKANKYKWEKKETHIIEEDNEIVLLQYFLITEQNV